jgi:predicted flap endonuclease-1-like 5' DNA nuclease
MKCTQRLYLTAGSLALVAAGSKDAVTLYAVPGDEIPESAAERFGLVDGHLKGFKPEAGEKEDKSGSDKEQKGGADKSGQGAPTKPELTKVKGIGEATARALAGAGINTIAELAAVDPANPPKIDGLSAVFNLAAVVNAAKELAGADGEPA